MTRNLLMSFLGTGKYIPCYYEYNDKRSKLTRYIQTAIYEHISSYVDNLEVIIFCTKEAEEANWSGLQETFNEIAPQAKVKNVPIPSEQDEDATWTLFEKIMDEIQYGDRIFFDVTHSFRTNPIVSLIVLNYAKVVKGAKFGGLMYGWIEKLGRIPEIEKINVEERIAPIVDLTGMTNLLTWTNGADQFIRTGNASVLLEIVNQELKHKKDDKKSELINVKYLINQLNTVGLCFETARANSLQTEINKWKEKTEEIKHSENQHFRQLIPLIDTIEKKVENFSDDEIMNYYYMSKWCYDHGLIQQGLTILVESVITVLCKLVKVDEFNKDMRDVVSSSLNVYLDKKPEEEWQGDIEFMKKVVKKIKPYREMLKPFQKLREYRNNINHAEMNKERQFQAKSFQGALKESLDNLRPFFEEMSKSLNSRTEVT